MQKEIRSFHGGLVCLWVLAMSRDDTSRFSANCWVKQREEAAAFVFLVGQFVVRNARLGGLSLV